VKQLGPLIRKVLAGEALIGLTPYEVHLLEKVPDSWTPNTLQVPPKMVVTCERPSKKQRDFAKQVKHEIMHSKEIGFVAPNSEGKPYVHWMHWWDAPEELQPVFRFLSRGCSWYLMNSDIDPKKKSPNKISFRGVRKWKETIREMYLVRKEDRGKRLVIMPKSLEEFWFQEEYKRRKMCSVLADNVKTVKIAKRVAGKCLRDENDRLITVDKKLAAKAYFIPKAHKPILSGRLVEDCRIYRAQISNTHKDNVNKIIKELAPWNFRDVSKAVHHILPNYRETGLTYFSGDIEKLFPSVPQEELLTMIRKKLGWNVYTMVSSLIHSYRIEFQGKFYAVQLGLPIGHPWSPALAEFYLSQKELEFDKKQLCRFARYADDTVFAVLPRNIDAVKLEYTKAVAPLKVTWECPNLPSRLKFLDASLSPTPVFKDRTMDKQYLERKRKAVYPRYLDKKAGLVNGEIPEQLKVQTILGKLLRIAQIESRTTYSRSGDKWITALEFLVPSRGQDGKEIRTTDSWKDILDQLHTDGSIRYLKNVKAIVEGHVKKREREPLVARSDVRDDYLDNKDLPDRNLTIRYCWHPWWRSKNGSRWLVLLKKSHQVRWDMRHVRNIGRLAKV